MPIVEHDVSFWSATMRSTFNCSEDLGPVDVFPFAFVKDGWGNVDAVVRGVLGFGVAAVIALCSSCVTRLSSRVSSCSCGHSHLPPNSKYSQ